MALATTPLTPAKKDECEKTFRELETMLEGAIRSFIYKHRMNMARHYDEMYSDALSSFMDAFEHYDENTGKMPFAQYLRFIVTHRLIDHIIRPGKKRSDKESRVVNKKDKAPREFQFQDLLDSLTPDGQELAKLIIDSPRELSILIANKGCRPIDYRSTIRKHLREIGWTAKRIKQTFLEVKEVI